MYTNIHSSFIYNLKILKTAAMSFNRWVVEQSLVYPWWDTGQQQKWTIGTHNNLNGPRGQDIQWKKSVSKGRVPFEVWFYFCNIIKNDKTIEMKNRFMVAREGGG